MNFSESFAPGASELIVIDDAREMDDASRLSRRLPKDLAMVRYAIHDRRLLRKQPVSPVSTHARVHANGIYVTKITDQFQTEMEIGGAGLTRYWFALANTGSMVVEQGRAREVCARAAGIALRGCPGTHLLSSDGNVRTNVWIDADELEDALSAMLGDGLRQALEFRTTIDWGASLAVSLRRQIGYFASELRRPDGLSSHKIALTSLTDLILQTVLLAFPHNYADRLTHRPAEVAPGILTRAEDFMRANAGQSLRMQQVAASAGCSIRTLNAVYCRLRGTTPLAALRAIRLANARDELLAGGDAAVGTISWRHGFSNAGRFAKAYRQTFGELPSETAVRRSASHATGRTPAQQPVTPSRTQSPASHPTWAAMPARLKQPRG